MKELMSELTKPFPPTSVKWRLGKTAKGGERGMALAYIDARDVMERLDQCFGFDWSDNYEETARGRIICHLSLKIGDEWITRSDGAGDTAYEGEKGAISDAFKRAAVKWGIGRYLYDLDAAWVDIEARGDSYIIARHEYKNLNSLLSGQSRNGHKHAAGTAVLVRGKNEERPGEITGLKYGQHGEPLYMINVDGKTLTVGDDKFEAVSDE